MTIWSAVTLRPGTLLGSSSPDGLLHYCRIDKFTTVQRNFIMDYLLSAFKAFYLGGMAPLRQEM